MGKRAPEAAARYRAPRGVCHLDHLKQTAISVILFIALLATGAGGYMTIEGWNFFDALYMTVITVATVGYSDPAFFRSLFKRHTGLAPAAYRKKFGAAP